MFLKATALVALLAAVGGAAFWLATAPESLGETELPEHVADLANGEIMFHAGGCASCHAAPGAKGEEKLRLGGGLVLSTPYGKFHAPNISPDRETGIGGWSTVQFVNAMKFGVGAEGQHLYPAFPYASYQRMRLKDLIDLKAFLDRLPPVANANADHELPFPLNIRRGIGLWKLLYLDGKSFEPDPTAGEEFNRGAYLATGPGHCGECHTPRNFIGGTSAWRGLSGGPAPEGEGTVPNITPDKETGIGDWSAEDIVTALSTGFTPEFDSLGGTMKPVQEGLSRLPPADLRAIAAYLKSVPAFRNQGPKPKPAD